MAEDDKKTGFDPALTFQDIGGLTKAYPGQGVPADARKAVQELGDYFTDLRNSFRASEPTANGKRFDTLETPKATPALPERVTPPTEPAATPPAIVPDKPKHIRGSASVQKGFSSPHPV